MKTPNFNSLDNFPSHSPRMGRRRRPGGHRRRHDGFGPGEQRGGPHGRGGPRGRGYGAGPGGRARRGAARLAILALLAQEPSNGYGLMKSIAEKTNGQWQPSPGSIYPALQLLTDEGLIQAVADSDSEQSGLSELTDAGREYVAEKQDRIQSMWQRHEGGGDVSNLRQAHEALSSVLISFRHATPAQREAAAAELLRTRQQLFQILAETDSAEPDSAKPESAEPKTTE